MPDRQLPPLPDFSDALQDATADSVPPNTPFPSPMPIPMPLPSMVLDPKKPGSEDGTEG